jgi:hypothetical protein
LEVPFESLPVQALLFLEGPLLLLLDRPMLDLVVRSLSSQAQRLPVVAAVLRSFLEEV